MTYELAVWIATPIVCLLLLVAGATVTTNKSRRRSLSLVAIGLAGFIALLLGAPVWLPIPYTWDLLTPCCWGRLLDFGWVG